LNLNNHSDYIISLDLGGTKLLGVLVNPAGEIKARLQVPSPRGNENLVKGVAEFIATLMKAAADMNIHPVGISIGAPGFIDTEHGVMVSADNLAVTNLPVADPIQRMFNVPVKIYHDVRSATMGEAHYGAGQGMKHFALLNIGTGVAVGLYLDGRLYHGARNQSGEIGHLAIAAVGPNQPVPDDSRLEYLTSGPAIVRRAVAHLADHPDSLVARLAGQSPVDVTAQIIQDAASEGDAYALQLIAETADYLGMAISAMLDILSLEAVILAGGISHMGDLLIKPLEASIARYAIEPIPVFQTRVGRDLGALGAAASFFFSGENIC
jgi:predicted NBD/HSP70 family sugar kinase